MKIQHRKYNVDSYNIARYSYQVGNAALEGTTSGTQHRRYNIRKYNVGRYNIKKYNVKDGIRNIGRCIKNTTKIQHWGQHRHINQLNIINTTLKL